jgi:hypothetical protein
MPLFLAIAPPSLHQPMLHRQRHRFGAAAHL